MYSREFTITVNGERFTISRVTKKTAEKRFNAGETVFIYPVYANPASPWWSGGGYDNENGKRAFQAFINAYSYYNCNAGTGKYLAYYLEKEG